MTVGELINKLKAMPEDLEIMRRDMEWGVMDLDDPSIAEIAESGVPGLFFIKHDEEDDTLKWRKVITV